MKHFITLILFLTFTLMSESAYSQSENRVQFMKIEKPTQGFSLPIDCKVGENCWIMNYVDMGPNDGKRVDPACFSRTYDTHKGTDFAILDGKTMQDGVDVIAPMDGRVKKIRNDQPDQWSTPEQIEEIKANRVECGNAVIIDHKNYETIYCHMKKDSVIVKPNQQIKRGDKIGEVGMSGFTAFPHLHFGITQKKKIIDPFTGQDNAGTCGKRIKSLWQKEIDLQYQPFVIQSTGFSNQIPILDDLILNNVSIEKISPNDDVITFWSIILGVEKGDNITIEIRDANNKIFATNKIIQEKTNARQFYYVGKKISNKDLLEGVYTGSIKVSRTDKKGNIIEKDEIKNVIILQK